LIQTFKKTMKRVNTYSKQQTTSIKNYDRRRTLYMFWSFRYQF